jgi:mono/diheme cytochrome c family protein
MNRRFVRTLVLAAAGWAIVGVVSLAMSPPLRDAANHFADADDKALVTMGKHVYALRCASCHGRSLQGQPLWQLADQDSWRRAPALDQTGHAWLRADEDLFRIAKFGSLDPAPKAINAMPAFGAILSDGEIRAAVAFIKARWPIGMRVAQSVLNPVSTGMPRDALQSEWTFPPTCRSR